MEAQEDSRPPLSEAREVDLGPSLEDPNIQQLGRQQPTRGLLSEVVWLSKGREAER